MKITKKYVIGLHTKLNKLANLNYEKYNFEKSIFFLKLSAKVAYRLNLFYKDLYSDELIKKISQKILSSNHIDGINDRVVFYDSFGWDGRGLTQQYIRALIELNINFLFIFECKRDELSRDITIELENYSKCEIFYVGDFDAVTKLTLIAKRIKEYSPSQALLHLSPWAVEALIIFSSFTSIRKININLTDHGFWLGSSIIDFNIEMRNYGANVSIQRRGLKNEQLLKINFYPIADKSNNYELPPQAKSKTVILTGGAFYKIYGEKGTFFKIIKRILDENPDVVVLYAGEGDSFRFKKFVIENDLADRVLLIGQRSDINEVFKKCDIFLGTYPLGGALMAQIAAANAKPILYYSSPEIPANFIDDLISEEGRMKITQVNLEKFFKFANLLCNDEEFRLLYGNELKQSLITSEKFAEKLKKYLINKELDMLLISEIEIDYDKYENLYMEIENKYNHQLKREIISDLKIRALFICPKLVFLYFKDAIFSKRIITLVMTVQLNFFKLRKIVNLHAYPKKNNIKI
jgi:hypothetical protein